MHTFLPCINRTTTQDGPDSQCSPDQTETNVSVWSLFDLNFPSTNQWLNYTSSGSKQKQTKENKVDWLRQNVQCEVSELQVMLSAGELNCFSSSQLAISVQPHFVKVYCFFMTAITQDMWQYLAHEQRWMHLSRFM